MCLYEEIFGKEIGRLVLEAQKNSRINLEKIARYRSLKALEKIKAILEDERLSDFDCIEQIVRVFEKLGSSCGSRHDF